ncbi:MAG: hypothetical protein NT117_10515 [Gammaproteobacteria bacterium]|nr:hypothetical protein [Gammaproteobacteria bacterium]
MSRSQRTTEKSSLKRFLAGLSAIIVTGLLMANSASASGTKFVLIDDEDAGFTSSGLSLSCFDNTVAGVLNGPPIGECSHYVNAAVGGVASATWNFGNISTGAGGNYTVEAFIPDDSVGNATGLTYTVQQNSAPLFCDGTWNAIGTFTGVSQDDRDGNWLVLGSIALPSTTSCFRVILTNASAASTSRMFADAMRMQREFESKTTIPDMPVSASALAAGTTYVTSATNGSPTTLATLVFACPKSGTVVVSGSGESAAVGNAGSAFIGLAYSISKDSTASDNSNVVQSSALSGFNGDANRDFLFVQRSDSCTGGTNVTYRLTGYATTPQTKIAGVGGNSFIWNARLTAQYTP